MEVGFLEQARVCLCSRAHAHLTDFVVTNVRHVDVTRFHLQGRHAIEAKEEDREPVMETDHAHLIDVLVTIPPQIQRAYKGHFTGVLDHLLVACSSVAIEPVLEAQTGTAHLERFGIDVDLARTELVTVGCTTARVSQNEPLGDCNQGHRI